MVMFGRSFRLFDLFGFSVKIDASWFLLAALISWSLAEGYFPATESGLEVTTYWLMGVAGAAGLFLSIVLHELAHAIVARGQGIEMRGITLFIFGGVAEMQDEPPSARAELLVAVAGPIASIVIAALAWGLTAIARLSEVGPAAIAVVRYLAVINVVLVAFNAVPAFPLDGGRVLRAALWQRWGDLRRATSTSSRIGSGFGLALIALGVVAVLLGDFVGGMWWFLIGLFLRNAARQSYSQLLLRQAFEGEPVSRFMVEDPVTVPRHVSVRELVEEYVYRHHFKAFPVIDGDRLVGVVTTRAIKDLPRDEWDSTSVGAIAEACDEESTVGPDDDAMEALSKMVRGNRSRLPVVDSGRLLGILALKDLVELFALRMELEHDRSVAHGRPDR